jgi:hypothetical protein
VSEDGGKFAYFVERDNSGDAVESVLDTRRL